MEDLIPLGYDLKPFYFISCVSESRSPEGILLVSIVCILNIYSSDPLFSFSFKSSGNVDVSLVSSFPLDVDVDVDVDVEVDVDVGDLFESSL